MQLDFGEGTRRDGITLYGAKTKMRERNYYAAMMVFENDADGMISGYSRAYPTVIKPVFEVNRVRAKGVTREATVNIMNTEKGPIVFGRYVNKY